MARRANSEGASNAREAAQWLPVADLRPNPRNPRLHGSEVAALARTILRTAWGAPIVAQARGRRIIGGHGRLEAAKLILHGIEVDGELRGGAEHSFGGPVGCVPVRLVDVSDAEADAMTLADNARALQGTDSAEAIVAMAAGFGRESELMADMGFDAAALDALVKSAGDAVLAAGGDARAPTDGIPAGDSSTEWEGMPEFASEDRRPHKSIIVHFASDEAVEEFKQLTGCRAFGGVNGSVTTWFPPVAPEARDTGRFDREAYVVE
jgi:hypothetical protein